MRSVVMRPTLVDGPAISIEARWRPEALFGARCGLMRSFFAPLQSGFGYNTVGDVISRRVYFICAEAELEAPHHQAFTPAFDHWKITRGRPDEPEPESINTLNEAHHGVAKMDLVRVHCRPRDHDRERAEPPIW